MNLKNFLKTLLMLIVFTALVNTSAFAANWYVSNTNGNDVVGAGTALSPFKSITFALSQASDGDYIYIDADTYNEAGANVAVTKAVHLVAQTFNGLNVVTITNGLTINVAASKTVYLGDAADNSQQFNLGITANALVLTSGNLNITQANVIIASGGTIQRSAGIINATPTTTNVNVTYTGNASLASGPELPASLGTGTLTVSMGTAATAVTFANDLALSSGQILVTLGTVNFNGNVSFTANVMNASAISNAGAGTVSFANAISFARSTTAGTPSTVISNGAAGTITLTGGVTTDGHATVGLTNNNGGTINVGAGTYAGPVNNNANNSTINLLTSVTFSNAVVSNGNAGAVIKLNGYQLTLSGTGNLTNTGNLISSTAGTVGSGVLNITGNVATTGAGQLPNVSVTSGGTLTLGANTSAYGSVTLNSNAAGAITDGGFNLTIYGPSFNRTDNTPGNYVATGTLTFASATAQSFIPGASLTLNNLVINKGSGAVVTLSASVQVAGNLTITAGGLDVGNYNLNLSGAASVFSNGGSAYSTTGVGYVVFMGAAGSVTGTGTFGNLLVNLSAAGATNIVTATSSINFSGTLYINKGQFMVADGNTVTFNNTTVANPTIKINTTAANNAGLTVNSAGAGTGTVNYSAAVNLVYFGSGAYNVNTIAPNGNAGGLEWIVQPLKLNNVTIQTSAVVTGFNGASTIAGTLTVASGATLAQGANIYTLSGDSKTHSIAGTVTGGTLLETGNGSAVNGSTATGDAATVNSLDFEPAANGASFTSSNLKVISSNLTIEGASSMTGATATVTMNSTDATLTGNLVVGNGTITPVVSVTIAGSNTSVFGGNLALANGTLTLTRGGNSTVIGGTVTLTAGTLNLGSNVNVTGVTTHNDAALNLGAYNYTANANYDMSGGVSGGTFSATSGQLIFAGAATFTPFGTNTQIPNLTINAAVTLANPINVTTAFVHTSGALTLGANDLTVSGATYTFKAGSYVAGTGAVVFTNAAAMATFSGDVTIPNLTINSTGAVTIQSDKETASPPVPRTITVSTQFTQTAGDVNLGINTLEITGGAGSFARTAGNMTMTTGDLNFNGAGLTFAPGTGWAVDNLTVTQAAANTGDNVFTINKNLILGAAFTTSNGGKDNILQIGDGATIERQANAATIDTKVTFLGKVNLLYSTAGPITLGNEVPTTDIINNFTIANPSSVVMNNSQKITINGTLSLAGLLDATTASPNGEVTMADGSTLELKINGTNALDQALTIPGKINIVYNGANATSTMELGAKNSSNTMHTTPTGNVTVKSAVTLDAGITVDGTLTLGASIDQTAANYTVNVNGDLVQTAANAFFADRAATVNFSGATTNLQLKATEQVPATLKFTVNKTSASDSLNLSGGNLDFATNAATLYLAQGVLVTGNNLVILKQANNGTGQPTQGFSKTGVSYVIGNVQKYINQGNLIDISYVQFPVGTPDGNYRQLDYYFKTAPQSSINLTVSAAAVSPGGDNGFPITTPDGLHLTNYAPFYWYVKSDIPLAPSYQYDMDAQAQGYKGYLTDQIQNVRFVRRDSGNVDNQWILQGGSSYDNSTIATNWPVVKVISATGGITTQGSIFAYSQLNKPPVFTMAAKDTTINGGDTLGVTFKATDPDLNQTVTLSLPTAPSWLSLDASTGKLTGIVPNKAATYNVTVRATDNLGATTDTTFAITAKYVNTPPKFTVQLANTNVKTDSTFTYQYQITDPDSGQTHTFWFGGSVPSFATLSSSGLLTIKPAFADLDSVFTFFVKVTDGIDTVSSANTTITVISGTMKGDVSGNGPDPAGASLVLQYAVGDTSVHLTPEQLYAADVDNNGVINAFDAANILYAYAHHDSLIGGGVLAKQTARGTIAFGNLSNEPNTNIVVLPISLSNSANVYSAFIKLNVGNDLATIQSVNGSLPHGWVMSHFYSNGVLKIAMAGTTPLTDGNIAEISFNLKNKDTHLTINGSVELNANVNTELGDVTVKQIPNKFALSQNYPNPFNPSTTIKYQLAKSARVTLEIYDILGQRVRTLVSEVQDAGYYKIIWDGSNNFGQKVSSGIYIYRLQAGSFVQTLKMNLLK